MTNNFWFQKRELISVPTVQLSGKIKKQNIDFCAFIPFMYILNSLRKKIWGDEFSKKKNAEPRITYHNK